MFVRTLALAVLVVAAVAVTGASASSAPSTLKLLSVQQQFTISPEGAPVLGSRFVFSNVIYNRAGQFGKPAGAVVGTSEGVCTIVGHARAQCTNTAHLPDGELVLMGTFAINNKGLTHATDAIVGGTGAYAAARGTVVTRDVSQTKTTIDVKLAS